MCTVAQSKMAKVLTNSVNASIPEIACPNEALLRTRQGQLATIVRTLAFVPIQSFLPMVQTSVAECSVAQCGGHVQGKRTAKSCLPLRSLFNNGGCLKAGAMASLSGPMSMLQSESQVHACVSSIFISFQMLLVQYAFHHQLPIGMPSEITV